VARDIITRQANPCPRRRDGPPCAENPIHADLPGDLLVTDSRQCQTGVAGDQPCDRNQRDKMTITPEFGEEERMNQQEARVRQRSEGVRPQDREDTEEREIEEQDRAEGESADLEPEDNEAHAPGKVCERCGAVITARQDVRRLPDGKWIHEVCPSVRREDQQVTAPS